MAIETLRVSLAAGYHIQIMMLTSNPMFIFFFSPIFLIRSMFTSGLTESSQREVRIVGVESESMHLVLDYAYTSRVALSECNVQALFTAASIFQIPALQDQCAQFMISRLDPQNCIGVFMFADAYGHQELRERSQDYIRKKVS